jgi:hypothetical protein
MKNFIRNSVVNLTLICTFLGSLGLAGVALAHEADCPYCKLKIVQNTKDQDNEVVVKFGNKKIEYRCIFCAIKDQKRYTANLVVYSPSEKVGEPVVLKRTDGKWTAPAGAVFLNSFKKHADCASLSRAFSSKTALDQYVTDHKIEDAKALSLDEFIAFVTKSAK